MPLLLYCQPNEHSNNTWSHTPRRTRTFESTDLNKFSQSWSHQDLLSRNLLGSCHENVPAKKTVASDLQSTDGLTVLARIEINAILVYYQPSYNTSYKQWNPVTHCCSPMSLCPAGCILQAKLTLRCHYCFTAIPVSTVIILEAIHPEEQGHSRVQICLKNWNVGNCGVHDLKSADELRQPHRRVKWYAIWRC